MRGSATRPVKAMQRPRGLLVCGVSCLIAGLVVPAGFLMLWEAGLFYGRGEDLVAGWILWDGVPLVVVGIAATLGALLTSPNASVRPVTVGLYSAATLVGVSTLLLVWTVWIPLARTGRITLATTLNLQGLPIVILVCAGIAFLPGYFSQK
jgi:hypothetical protein